MPWAWLACVSDVMLSFIVELLMFLLDDGYYSFAHGNVCSLWAFRRSRKVKGRGILTVSIGNPHGEILFLLLFLLETCVERDTVSVGNPQGDRYSFY